MRGAVGICTCTCAEQRSGPSGTHRAICHVRCKRDVRLGWRVASQGKTRKNGRFRTIMSASANHKSQKRGCRAGERTRGAFPCLFLPCKFRVCFALQSVWLFAMVVGGRCRDDRMKVLRLRGYITRTGWTWRVQASFSSGKAPSWPPVLRPSLYTNPPSKAQARH
jgi:hypothetical protein